MWNGRWLDWLRQDVMYAARLLWRSPGFTVTAVSVLAFGIGANLAEFHLFEATTFRRYSVRDASSLAHFVRVVTENGMGHAVPLPYPEITFIQEHSKSFSYVVRETFSASILGEDGKRTKTTFVSPNYFSSLDVKAERGRILGQLDAQPGALPAAVLGYRYWQQHFRADPNIVTQPIMLSGKAVRVVGVLSSDFGGLSPGQTDIWLPIDAHPYLASGEPLLQGEMFAKLRAGVSIGAAVAELRHLNSELPRQRFRSSLPEPFILGGLLQPPISLAYLRGQPVGLMVVVLVLLVLFSACANLGSILIARGVNRAREIQIRIALGASRGRIVRQLITENILLAMLGSAAGLWVGQTAARLILNAMGSPPDMKVLTDWNLVIASGVLGLGAVVSFGLAPALFAVGRTARYLWLRSASVAVQVIVSVVLLILSDSLIRSVQSNGSIDGGSRNLGLVIGMLGGTATILAAIGLFGLMAFTVAQRTREIGLRIALGARPVDILRSLFARYATPLGIGLLAGAALSWAGRQVLQTRIPHLGPLLLTLPIGCLTILVLTAALIPAIRALRVDPSSTLRHE